MFKRSFRSNSTSRQAGETTMDPQYKVDKSARLKSKGSNLANSARDQTKLSKLQRSLTQHREANTTAAANPQANLAPSPIVTLCVGPEGRLFAAHEDILCRSPFFNHALRGGVLEQSYAQARRFALPEEDPEVFSAILEYLYKGDYSPRLVHNKQRQSWELEGATRSRGNNGSPQIDNGGDGQHEATIYFPALDSHILRDTVVYCAAGRYGLDELQRLALRKQGLQAAIDVGTILRSAQYCYAHTPDSDSRLRAHYLALIIRCRRTFKRSGTMQAAMEQGGGEGGKLFFDLFVAMCNHLDDVIEVGNKGSPRTI